MTDGRSRTDITAVILAGGLGTRLRSLFPDTPKGAVPVGDRSFVRLLLGGLRQAGVTRAILLTGYLADAVEAEAMHEAGDGFRISFVREDTPLGTGGAVVNALPALPDGPFIVLNGDTWVEIEPAALIGSFTAAGADALIAASRVNDASEGGRLEVDDHGWLTAFREKQPGGGLMNAGVYVMTAKALAPFAGRAPLSLENEIFPELLSGGAAIHVFPIEEGFFDIGTPDRYRAFEARVAGRRNRK